MTRLGPESLNQVLSACQSSLVAAGAALQVAFGEAFRVEVGSCGRLDSREVLNELECSGLVLVYAIAGQAALLLLPETGILLPENCQSPDDNRLADLAKRLGDLWLAPTTVIDQIRTGYLPSTAEALLRGGASDAAVYIQLPIQNSAGQQANAYLIWPIEHPAAVLDTSLPVPIQVPRESARRISNKSRESNVPPALPSYTQSLLHISVPVTVTLAAQRLSLARILELAPGSLLQFEKSCDELIELEVNGHSIAVGEAVKVGDKFGMRVSSMILPAERFIPIGKPQK